MRRYILVLLGSFSLLIASACSRPAPAPELPKLTTVDYLMNAPERHVTVDTCSDAPSKEQVQVSQVATSSEELVAPRPRFYTRWRRVHGRWYHFTYRVGDKRCAMVTDPDPRRQSRIVA